MNAVKHQEAFMLKTSYVMLLMMTISASIMYLTFLLTTTLRIRMETVESFVLSTKTLKLKRINLTSKQKKEVAESTLINIYNYILEDRTTRYEI